MDIQNGRLYGLYRDGQGVAIERLEIESNKLIVYYREGDKMAKIDLGQVVGAKGDTGAKGETGAQGTKGETGAPGADGKTPTFSLENGHLFVDYDNPVPPARG